MGRFWCRKRNYHIHDAVNGFDIVAAKQHHACPFITGNTAGPIFSVQTAAARKGTFVCTNAGSIVVANAKETATSDVIISMNTLGRTITTPLAMKTISASGHGALWGDGYEHS